MTRARPVTRSRLATARGRAGRPVAAALGTLVAHGLGDRTGVYQDGAAAAYVHAAPSGASPALGARGEGRHEEDDD